MSGDEIHREPDRLRRLLLPPEHPQTIPLAIQCYVFASHVYGPRGQKIPKRGKTLPQTYNSLLDKWDAFGNAMVELELVFPYSNQTPLPIGVSNGVVGLANVFGFATTLYPTFRTSLS